MTAIAVTIAGSDSGGGAGVQADLKTFSALGVYGASVITALTAQNTLGVHAVHDVPADFVRAQMKAVFGDLAVNAVKIGMLSQTEVIETVVSELANYPLLPIILDPVMVATSGDRLLASEAVSVLKATLMKRADLITPNLHEAAFLTGLVCAKDDDEMMHQAMILLDDGARAVLLKGGHGKGTTARDFFCNQDTGFWLAAPRHETKNTHGTGCTLSSAIAAECAKGISIPDALKGAKEFVTRAIEAADTLKVGKGYGPTHHFYDFW